MGQEGKLLRVQTAESNIPLAHFKQGIIPHCFVDSQWKIPTASGSQRGFCFQSAIVLDELITFFFYKLVTTHQEIFIAC